MCNSSGRARRTNRERELVVSLMTPPPVIAHAFARLVPALYEVVVHIGCCRSDNLDVGIVAMALGVTRSSCGSRGEIYAADKRHFGGSSGIDQPTLLVMEVVPVRAIPTSPEGRSSCPKDVAILRGPLKCGAPGSPRTFGVGRQKMTRTSKARAAARSRTSNKEPRPSGMLKSEL
jgi:hypothetical protein